MLVKRKEEEEEEEEEEVSLGVIMTNTEIKFYILLFTLSSMFLSLFHLIFSSHFIVHCPQFWPSVFK